MVFKLKKYSDTALMICLMVIVGKSFILLSGSFNKLALILNFIYLLFAFYFFIIWEIEVKKAAFNPRFSVYDLEKKSRFNLCATISTNENDTNALGGVVTNIDEGSCFLLLQEKIKVDFKLKRRYLLEATYEGVHFRHYAKLVSFYDQGVGFILEESPDGRVSWSELYKVCLERGLTGKV
jgi:hypothetical protein